jgi:hypothetical protein
VKRASREAAALGAALTPSTDQAELALDICDSDV